MKRKGRQRKGWTGNQGGVSHGKSPRISASATNRRYWSAIKRLDRAMREALR